MGYNNVSFEKKNLKCIAERCHQHLCQRELFVQQSALSPGRSAATITDPLVECIVKSEVCFRILGTSFALKVSSLSSLLYFERNLMKEQCDPIQVPFFVFYLLRCSKNT